MNSELKARMDPLRQRYQMIPPYDSEMARGGVILLTSAALISLVLVVAGLWPFAGIMWVFLVFTLPYYALNLSRRSRRSRLEKKMDDLGRNCSIRLRELDDQIDSP